jgi:hypothetical protein
MPKKKEPSPLTAMGRSFMNTEAPNVTRECRIPGVNAPPRQPGVAYPCEREDVLGQGQASPTPKPVTLPTFSWSNGNPT